LKAG
jgi:hypothetical protein